MFLYYCTAFTRDYWEIEKTIFVLCSTVKNNEVIGPAAAFCSVGNLGSRRQSSGELPDIEIAVLVGLVPQFPNCISRLQHWAVYICAWSSNAAGSQVSDNGFQISVHPFWQSMSRICTLSFRPEKGACCTLAGKGVCGVCNSPSLSILPCVSY